MATVDSYQRPDTPEFWLHRLTQRLQNRQERYETLIAYAVGNHPLPNGDPRFKMALQEFQRKAKTNYVGLANKAVTDRMALVGFKFGTEGEVDKDAKRIWKSNSMDSRHKVAITDAAMLGEVYALVSPPREEGGDPRITIEDPRVCIIEEDPGDCSNVLAGLKFYHDTVLGIIVAIVYMPKATYVYHGPGLVEYLKMDTELFQTDIQSGTGAWQLVEVIPNPIGKVPLVRGVWRPEFGVRGMAECEDGGFPVQDRINHTILMRMVVGNSQAFRQRWVTGGQVNRPKKRGKGPSRPPFEPAADAVWAMADPNSKFGDFEQADITQLLKAAEDDIGDFAAITQTPVTALTNKMVNVSGTTLTVAQATMISKVKTRMEAMGYFFEHVMKLCFAYLGDARADDAEAEVLWADPELRTMAEMAEFISKANGAIPPRLLLEKAGFTPDEVEMGVQEIEKMQQKAIDDQIRVAKEARPPLGPGQGQSGGSSPKPKK